MGVVLTETRGKIFVVTLNRPDVRNAWNQDMVDAFRRVWVEFDRSDALVCVVHGAGSTFSSGLDVRSPPRSDDGAMPNTAVPCNKPIIAATEGVCLGMACTFVMFCDIVISGASSSFAYLEARMGMHGGQMAGFPGRMLYKPGLQWMLTGDRMTAQRACEIGMINEVVEDGKAFERAMEIAERIARNAPLAVQSMKAIAMESLPRGPFERHYKALEMIEAMRRSEDLKEGIAALRDRRDADFKGR
jgi:enoyl-CoA hydratase